MYLSRLLILTLIIQSATTTLATASAPSPVTDVMKHAINPYYPGKVRSLFLRASGADNELDENEFKKDLSSHNGFAKIYDRWSTIKQYDCNKNNTIDWFEFNQYRTQLRKVIFYTYDKDQNNKLSPTEHQLANKALLSKRVPCLNTPKPTLITRSRIAKSKMDHSKKLVHIEPPLKNKHQPTILTSTIVYHGNFGQPPAIPASNVIVLTDHPNHKNLVRSFRTHQSVNATITPIIIQPQQQVIVSHLSTPTIKSKILVKPAKQ